MLEHDYRRDDILQKVDTFIRVFYSLFSVLPEFLKCRSLSA